MIKDRIAVQLREGEAAASSGKKRRARRAFRSVLRLDPHNVMALLWLTWLDRRPAHSLAYAKRALACQPDNVDLQKAVTWARERAGSAPARHRWRWITGIGMCLLLLVAGGTLGYLLLNKTPVAQASASISPPTATLAPSPTPTRAFTPTPVPSWTPTFTPPPRPSITPSPVLLTPTAPSSTPSLVIPTLSLASFHDDVSWIDVSLSEQTLSAYEGQKLVLFTHVSTGLAETPTPIGLYRIQIKMRYDDMEGDDYYLRNVPYVMYFYKGYALHGTYWHAKFGQPASHGCVNMPTERAAWLFEWAGVGTLVYIHD